MRRAKAQFDAGANMTDVLAALSLLADAETPARDAALAAFHARWHGDDLVLDKWFSIQAMSHRADTIAQVRTLYAHPDFDLRNPNRARSLIGAFASGNPVRFHDASGEGYRFLGDAVIALDPINGSMAARLISPLGLWRRQSPDRAALMRAELERILATPKLSKGTFEKASKGLA
jgi:aminopeptidase N